MGLDMYLNKKTYIGNYYKEPEDKVKIEISGDKENKSLNEIKQDRISYINAQVAYWRKANQIHNWFVQYVQNGEDDCREYFVSKDQLQDLVNLCKKVKESKELAEELLPTQGGFFFGSTDYDDYYMEDIQNTIDQIEPLLEENEEFYYSSSW